MKKDKTRFKYHLENDDTMRFFLLQSTWEEYEKSSITEDMINLSKAGIVSYPSGEAMFMYGNIYPAPEGITFNNGAIYQDEGPDYSKSLLKAGKDKVSIYHGDSLSQDEDPRSHYSTSISNQSDSKIKVFKFAAYRNGFFGRLSRESEGFYSPRQFREWYRVPDEDGWILPGQTVCDPDNFGYGNGYWLYFFEDDNGNIFTSSASLGRR